MMELTGSWVTLPPFYLYMVGRGEEDDDQIVVGETNGLWSTAYVYLVNHLYVFVCIQLFDLYACSVLVCVDLVCMLGIVMHEL